MVFTIKYRAFRLKFSHHPILCLLCVGGPKTAQESSSGGKLSKMLGTQPFVGLQTAASQGEGLLKKFSYVL